MKIQKIIESQTNGSFNVKIIEYEITTERMQNLPHTFGNFRDEVEFHSAFFDQNHPQHMEAYEILEHVLKPTVIYADEHNMETNEFWASGDDLRMPIGNAIFI